MGWSLSSISTAVKVKTALKILNLTGDQYNLVSNGLSALGEHPVYQGFDLPEIGDLESIIAKVIDAQGSEGAIDTFVPREQQAIIATLLQKPQIRSLIGSQSAKLLAKSAHVSEITPIIEKFASLPIFLDENGDQIAFTSVDHFISEGVLPKLGGVLTQSVEDADASQEELVIAKCPFCDQTHVVHI